MKPNKINIKYRIPTYQEYVLEEIMKELSKLKKPKELQIFMNGFSLGIMLDNLQSTR